MRDGAILARYIHLPVILGSGWALDSVRTLDDFVLGGDYFPCLYQMAWYNL